MTNRLSPEMLIPAKEVNRCADCPFFEDSVNGWGEVSFYCNHKEAKDIPVGGIAPRYFRVDGGAIGDPFDENGIWIGCPLPKVDTV